MCYTGLCPYEISSGPGAGDCSLPCGQRYPFDAACVRAEMEQSLMFELCKLKREALAALEKVEGSEALAAWYRRYITGTEDRPKIPCPDHGKWDPLGQGGGG